MMQQLLRVTRDTEAGNDLYLYYSEKPIAKTVSMDDAESVMIDFDAAGGVVGVELLDPDTESLELLTKIAREHELSLDRLFAFA